MLFNYGDRFLYKQSYSNNTSFYTLQDYRGNWKLGYGSNNLSEIIAQLKQELKSYLELNLKQLADKHSKMINDMEGLLINS